MTGAAGSGTKRALEGGEGDAMEGVDDGGGPMALLEGPIGLARTVVGAVTNGNVGCKARCVRMEGSCPIMVVVNEEEKEAEEDDWGGELGVDERVIGARRN